MNTDLVDNKESVDCNRSRRIGRSDGDLTIPYERPLRTIENPRVSAEIRVHFTDLMRRKGGNLR